MAENYRFLGKPAGRKDARDIVTGKAQFIDDIAIPDMLYGKVLRSPYPHAVIKGIKTEEALNLPGVHAVLTHENVPDWRGGALFDVRVLDRKVRYVGDAVALVAARTEDIAEKALDCIEVAYEKLPAVFDIDEALSPEAPLLYEQYPHNVLPGGYKGFGPKSLKDIMMGDAAKGLEEADFVVEGTASYTHIPNPLPIEPPGVIAKWEGPGQLTIWSASQSPAMSRFNLLPMMRFPDIRCISTHCGGSYGSKNYALLPMFYAAALARATGRPVKLYYTKEEHFGAFSLRLGARFQGRIGIKRDGSLTAVAGELFIDTGAFSDSTQLQIAVGCGEAQLRLRCANWDVRSKLVCTNHSAAGMVRGFGGQEFESAMMPVLMDALIRADLEPVAFFKKNFVKPGEGYYWRDGEWYTCRGKDYSEAVEKGAGAFGWYEKWRGWLKPSAVEGTKRIGIGVGVHGCADVGEDVSEASVRLNPDGTVTIHICVSEPGVSQRNSLCKMVAETLQLPLDRINITPPDTLVNPFEFGLVGSRGTYALGSAVISAAEDAKRKLLDRASTLLKSAPDDLFTRDGKVYVKDRNDPPVSWSKVMGIMQTCTGAGRFDPDHTMSNFIIMFVEVEVDTETGRIEIRDIVLATDVGQIIDPLSLEGQFHGCLGSAGTDSALFEETILDRKSGHMLNLNMMDYKWRTFMELPEIHKVVLETPFDTHRYKAIGVGEIMTSPGPGAVLMAVSNAIGKSFYDYPLTPDKVLGAWNETGGINR